MKRILTVALSCYCVMTLLGCACVKESIKGFLAVSTKEIENVRDKAIVKVVDYDYESCYKKVEDILDGIGSSIYAKRQDFIAVYISQTDTTPAGIFFKGIGSNKTQLEIASPASDTKEYLADKVFAELSGE